MLSLKKNKNKKRKNPRFGIQSRKIYTEKKPNKRIKRKRIEKF